MSRGAAVHTAIGRQNERVLGRPEIARPYVFPILIQSPLAPALLDATRGSNVLRIRTYRWKIADAFFFTPGHVRNGAKSDCTIFLFLTALTNANAPFRRVRRVGVLSSRTRNGVLLNAPERPFASKLVRFNRGVFAVHGYRRYVARVI